MAEKGDVVRVVKGGQFVKGEVTTVWPDGTHTVTFKGTGEWGDYGYYNEERLVSVV